MFQTSSETISFPLSTLTLVLTLAPWEHLDPGRANILRGLEFIIIFLEILFLNAFKTNVNAIWEIKTMYWATFNRLIVIPSRYADAERKVVRVAVESIPPLLFHCDSLRNKHLAAPSIARLKILLGFLRHLHRRLDYF